MSRWNVTYIVGNTYKRKYVLADTAERAIKKARVKAIEELYIVDENNNRVCCYNCTHCRHYYSADMFVCGHQHRQIADEDTAHILFTMACDGFSQREAGDDIGDTI